MTASQLLATLATAIQARLPGWTVRATPQPDLGDKTVELGLGAATATHYQYAGPAMEEQVLVRLSVRNAPGAYESLVDARDAVVLAAFDLYADFLAVDVELLPQGSPGTWEPPSPEASSTQGVYWTVLMRIPVRRKL